MTPSAVPVPEGSQVVLIGVSEYDDPALHSYDALANGVEELARLLKDPRILGVPDGNCHVITGAEATRDRIHRTLTDAAERTTSLLFVYFAGHGHWSRREHPTRLTLAHKQVEHDDFLDWMPFEWLRGHLARGRSPRAKHRVLVMETCHSGAALEHGTLAGAGTWVDDDRSDLSTILTACDKAETARVVDGEPYPLFASALIDVLRSGIEGKGGFLTPDEICDAIRAEIGDVQTPRLVCADGAGAQPLFGNRRAAAPAAVVPGKSTIPPLANPLFGHREQVERLLEGARSAAEDAGPFIGVITGKGGYGKSLLAHAVAAELGTAFAWRLHLDLRASELARTEVDSLVMLRELLIQSGQTPPNCLASSRSRWTNWLAEHRVLLVLDNVADARQIEAAMPPADSRCAVLATSRDPLRGLPSATTIELGPLGRTDAVALLRHHVGDRCSESELVALAAEACGVPAVLHALGGQLEYQPPRILLERMRRSGSGVMKEIFRSTVANLEPDALRRTALACGLHPGPSFDPDSIAAMTGADGDDTWDHCHSLSVRRILKPLPGYRYRLHDEDRAFAPAVAAALGPDTAEHAGDRLWDWTARRVDAAVSQLWGSERPSAPAEPDRRIGFAEPHEAEHWLSRASDELLVSGRLALRRRHERGLRMAAAYTRWLRLRGRFEPAAGLLNELKSVPGDESAIAASLGLGDMARLQGEDARSERFFHRAIAIAVSIDDVRSQVRALDGLGGVARLRAQHDKARGYFDRALDLAESIGDLPGQGHALWGLGVVFGGQGEWDTAAEQFDSAMRTARRVGDRIGEASAQWGMGQTLKAIGNREGAKHAFRSARRLYAKVGWTDWAANCEEVLAQMDAGSTVLWWGISA